MNITRHNYEEFFLLYVDKELSAAGRKAVDVFVQENPDLQMELALLQQTVVSGEDIVLQKKDWLYMEEGITALQESLLLYADDELNIADKNAVESLLNTNAGAISEWSILQQTKLQPDMAVVFEDKALLYRKEEGRVVGFKWWRVAAAAVLLALGLSTGVLVYKNNFQKTNEPGELVKENKIKPGQKKTGIGTTDQHQATPDAENVTAENNMATPNKQNDTELADNKVTAFGKADNANDQKNAATQQNTTLQNANSKKPGNNLPKPYFENINNKTSNEVAVRNVQSENNNNVRVSGSNEPVVKTDTKEDKTIVADISNNKANANLTAIQVANANTDNGEGNSYLDVDNNKGKRTALGGFLRKAKRVLERTANVKTGEGIKIAGFEIALK